MYPHLYIFVRRFLQISEGQVSPWEEAVIGSVGRWEGHWCLYCPTPTLSLQPLTIGPRPTDSSSPASCSSPLPTVCWLPMPTSGFQERVCLVQSGLGSLILIWVSCSLIWVLWWCGFLVVWFGLFDLHNLWCGFLLLWFGGFSDPDNLWGGSLEAWFGFSHFDNLWCGSLVSWFGFYEFDNSTVYCILIWVLEFDNSNVFFIGAEWFSVWRFFGRRFWNQWCHWGLWM